MALYSQNESTKLREIAHARAGDKGTTINLAVIANDDKHYETIRQYLSAERVRQRFSSLALGDVDRFELPGIGALNFVLHKTRMVA